jgi:hypothetical protein
MSVDLGDGAGREGKKVFAATVVGGRGEIWLRGAPFFHAMPCATQRELQRARAPTTNTLRPALTFLLKNRPIGIAGPDLAVPMRPLHTTLCKAHAAESEGRALCSTFPLVARRHPCRPLLRAYHHEAFNTVLGREIVQAFWDDTSHRRKCRSSSGVHIAAHAAPPRVYTASR